MDEKIDFKEEDIENPEKAREYGKRLLYGKDVDREGKVIALYLISHSANKGDPEAQFILGYLILSKSIEKIVPADDETGLRLICAAAENGYPEARNFLNKYTNDRYVAEVQSKLSEQEPSPLKDFDGKQIKINRKGVFSPVDAGLEFRDGKNILTLSANVIFTIDDSDGPIPDCFYDAVLDGFREWEGEYLVFGNQKLTVKVELTNEDRLFDNVMVVTMTKNVKRDALRFAKMVGREEKLENFVSGSRSFARMGVKKWSVHSRKYVYISTRNGKFDDYEEVKVAAKHEFGHVLGLGDLYYSEADGLKGVERGTFRELDSYAVADKKYHLVMDNGEGPISNNDIEMVVLAFSENRAQYYQAMKSDSEISKALGRGN